MMSMKVWLCVSAVCVLLPLMYAQSNIMDKHQFHASLDEDSKYVLYWSYDNAMQIMTFTVEVKTTGWIGFGISPYTGKMPGSDVVIGWVDNNGKAYLQDRFAESRSLPLLDDQQDYNLVSGNEVNGITTLTFSRKWNTKDSHDIPLDRGTTRLIWSYHEKDPTGLNEIPIHQKMGARSINLFERVADADKPTLPADTQTYDLLAPNVTVPSVTTTYWCVGLQLPQVIGKHHIIKIDPEVKKNNEGVVHHMLLFECESDPKWHGYSSECSSKNMPGHLKRCRGGSAIAAWAVGGESILFPAQAGFPLGSKSSPKFAIIEMHYDNPEQKSGIIDSSGFRLYYTKQLRQYDVGIFTIGNAPFLTMIIPEKQTKWDIFGYCPKYCTEKAIPKDGINVFGSFLHTHLTGTSLTTRHFRNGTELPILVENKHYDFNYQEVLYLKKEVKVLPGDSLALTCTYKTTNRDKITVAGLETIDEMCFNFLYYYPRMPFAACISVYSYDLVFPFLMKLIKSEKMPVPRTFNTTDLMIAMKNTTIGDQKLIDELRAIETYSTPDVICLNNDLSPVTKNFTMKIPNFIPVANYTSAPTSPPNSKATSICSTSLLTTLIYMLVTVLIIR